jgi:hypothetical protein
MKIGDIKYFIHSTCSGYKICKGKVEAINKKEYTTAKGTETSYRYVVGGCSDFNENELFDSISDLTNTRYEDRT